MDEDCNDYTLPALPLETLPPTVPSYEQLTTKINGINPEEEEFYVKNKFYKISQIRVWAEDSFGISGFEVTYTSQSDFTGYEPITKMFGEPNLKEDYEVINVDSSVEIT